MRGALGSCTFDFSVLAHAIVYMWSLFDGPSFPRVRIDSVLSQGSSFSAIVDTAVDEGIAAREGMSAS